jgi:hypothetical protein
MASGEISETEFTEFLAQSFQLLVQRSMSALTFGIRQPEI